MAAAPTNIVNDINTKVTDAVNSMTSNGSNVIAKVMAVAGGSSSPAASFCSSGARSPRRPR